ncbi:MAG TPA: ferrous iron transporter B, partial [Thermoprotei archaeon]|nr:ferrous iron transporter B [Thermoprotei archaeon]
HMLIETLLDIIERRIRVRPYRVNYGSVEYYIREIERKLSYAECGKLAIYPRRWLAIRLLEGDSELEGLMKEECGELKNTVDEIKTRAEQEMGSSITMMLINERHKFIEELVSSCLKIEKVASPSFTEYLDSIFLSPIWGLPTTIALVSSMLILIFTVNTGFPLNILFQFMGYHHLAELVEEYSISGLFSEFFSLIADSLRIYLDDIGFPIWIRELIASGIIEGVGGVLGFFPLVFMVYIVYGLLEDSGLMARIAVVGDRIARKMGLSGKALIPLFLGLGCNVPAILGSRILEEDKEKLLVNLISPLVPCQARLFVLLAIISSLSISLTMQVALVLLTYLLVVVLIFILAYLFHIFIFTKYKAPELLIELPPYHSPSLRVVAWYAWERGEHFLRKAGTIILTLSIITWILTSYGLNGYTENPSESFAVFFGRMLAPILSPMGLNDWHIALAFETGFIAKESVISTLIITTNTSTIIEAMEVIGLDLSSIISMMIMMILYTPCIPTLVAFLSEVRNKRYTFLLL